MGAPRPYEVEEGPHDLLDAVDRVEAVHRYTARFRLKDSEIKSATFRRLAIETPMVFGSPSVGLNLV